MRDLVLNIQSLSDGLSDLKKKIADYDKEISKSSATADKLDKIFRAHNVTAASAMDINKLSQSVNELTERYNALASVQDNLRQKKLDLNNAIQQEKQLQEAVAQAQRNALSVGDQAGATQLYNQYIEAGHAINAFKSELNGVEKSLTSVGSSVDSTADTLYRYEQVLKLIGDGSQPVNIEAANAAFREQENELISIIAQLKEYENAISGKHQKIAAKEIAPQDMESTLAQIDEWKAKMVELEKQYQNTATLARDLAAVAGKNPSDISLESGVKIPKMEKSDAEIIKEAASNLKEYARNAEKAKDKVDDIAKSASKLAGMAFGVHSIKEFGQKVIETRGEMQKLEVAFTTLLGSEKKADKLMQQLAKTAATTPFDLQSISRGAKQLMAYGTSAEEVNDIIVHLGDIAAGLSQPLDSLVYLYGTTMVQGQMMTRDLRQLQGRGIPIVEQLAKQFGVAENEVQGLVSAGKVTAEEFHKAMMGMSSDGGKFANLMEAQSKTMSGQISNLKDNISMMFNEIGKDSEGMINAGIGAVSALVENYKAVGTVVIGLISTYGVYKAALMATIALKAIEKKATRLAIASKGAESAATMGLTAKTWALVKAQLAHNAALLASPAGLATLAIVGLGAAIWGLCNAQTAQEKAQNKVNNAMSSLDERLAKQKQDADGYINTIQSETASELQKLQAYEALKKIMPEITKQYTLQDLAAMNAVKTQELMNDTMDAKQLQEKYNLYQEAQDKLQKMYAHNESLAASGAQGGYYGVKDFEEQKGIVAGYKAEYEELKKLQEEAAYNELSIVAKIEIKTKELTSQQEIYNENKAKADEYYAQAKKAWEDSALGASLKVFGVTFEDQVAKGAVMMPQEYFTAFNKAESAANSVNVLTGEVNNLNTQLNGQSLETLKTQLTAIEAEIETARAVAAVAVNADNIKKINDLESNRKEIQSLIDAITGGKSGRSGGGGRSKKDLRRERERGMRDALKSEENILVQEYSKRYQLALKRKQQIDDIDREIKEWKEDNKGKKLPDFFEKKKEVAQLQFEADMSKAEQEYNDFIANIEKDTINIKFNLETSAFDKAIDYTSNYVDRQALMIERFNKQYSKTEQELIEQERKTAEERFSLQTLQDYTLYKGGATGARKDAKGNIIGWSEVEKKSFEDIENFYRVSADNRSAVLHEMQEMHKYDIMGEDLNNFQNYLDGVVSAEREYQQALKDIRSSHNLSENADIENADNLVIREAVNAAKAERDRRLNIISSKTGIDDNLLVERVVNFGENILNKTNEEIRVMYQTLVSDLDSQLAGLEDKLDIARKAQGTTLSDAESQYAKTQAALSDEGITEEQKVELLRQQAELEAIIAYHKGVQNGTEMDYQALLLQSNSLLATKAKVQELGFQIENKQGEEAKKAAESAKKTSNQWRVTKQSLEATRDAINSVADALEGNLSEGGKKAIKTMSAIVDAGIEGVNGIESLLNSVTEGFKITTKAAVAEMSALEKASFILTIISVAFSIITKIAQALSQFSQQAQLQSAINAHLEKVEQLKRANEKLQRQYESKVGVEYYKGLYKVAKDYNNILKEQKEALEDAQQLYNTYGNKDSDKAKEAKEQIQDIEDDIQDTLDNQSEIFQQITDDLATTNLQSFSENLADALVEGFESGSEGIKDAFDNVLDDLYRAMLKKQLSLALESQFEDVFESIEKKTQDDGVLSQKEIDEIMNAMDMAEENAKAIAESYYNIFSERGLLDDADTEGSEGFGQMTQDQADTLTARFTAVQIEMSNVSAATQAMASVVSGVGEDVKLGLASIQSLLYNSNIALQMAEEQLSYVQTIADNTAMLTETNNRLRAIEQNTGRL